MNKTIKITLLTVLLAVSLITTYGQTASNKIIFLTDVYTNFVDKVNADSKNSDNIYKENIQNAICDKHFQKSEYADIVKGFFEMPTKNTVELNKSINRISLNKEIIEAKINGALKKSNAQLDNDSLIVYILPVTLENRQTIEHMGGIMGLTAGSKQILLTIEPEIKDWENMLEYAVAHEFNHAYWTKMNFGKSTKWTLLDYLVFEGRGDYFAHKLYPNVKTSWTMALTENQKSQLWNKIKPNLRSEDFGYQQEIMFGSMNYPIWGGYSLGYDIVLSALTNNKDLNAINWTNLSSDKILEQSKYK